MLGWVEMQVKRIGPHYGIKAQHYIFIDTFIANLFKLCYFSKKGWYHVWVYDFTGAWTVGTPLQNCKVRNNKSPGEWEWGNAMPWPNP